MRNMWLVARREFIARGKSGAYLITTALMMVILLGTTIGPAFIDKSSATTPIVVHVLDKSGQVFAPLQAAIAAIPAGPSVRSVQLDAVTGEEEILKEQTRKEGKSILVVAGSFPGDLKVQFLSANPSLLSAAGVVLGPLESIVRAAKIQARGVDPAVAADVLKPLDAEAAQLTAAGGTRDSDSFMGALLQAMGVMMALYMAVLVSGQFVFQGVLEEKVSRVMEVMASHVTAGQMLAGKVIGLGALGLVQFAATIVAWFGGTVLAHQLTDMPSQPLRPGVILLALLFMMLGYLLSATLFAAAGAIISRMEDQQTVLTPMTMLIVLPMMFIGVVINDPGGTATVVLSMIPFFSQSLMVMRMLTTDVPAWQMTLSLLLMAGTALAATWAGGRVYRAAMLSYGSRPSLRQVWQYLKMG